MQFGLILVSFSVSHGLSLPNPRIVATSSASTLASSNLGHESPEYSQWLRSIAYDSASVPPDLPGLEPKLTKEGDVRVHLTPAALIHTSSSAGGILFESNAFVSFLFDFVFVSLVIALLVWFIHRKINQRIHYEVEERDRELIGTDIHIGRVFFNPFNGCLYLYDLDVDNMKGYTCKTIFKADRILVDLNMQLLLTSLGKNIQIEQLALHGIHVTVEKTLTSSNVAAMLKFVSDAQGDEEDKPPSDVEFELHKLVIKDIQATTALSTSFFGKLDDRKELGSLTWPIGDIVYQNLMKKGGMHVVIKAILKGVLQKVVSSLSVASRCGPPCCS